MQRRFLSKHNETQRPQQALDALLELNDRYALDGHSPPSGAAAVASLWAAAVTEIYLCNVCAGQKLLRCFLAAVVTEIRLCNVGACQEILRRSGRGQSVGCSAAWGSSRPPRPRLRYLAHEQNRKQ
eukprot:COSAG01_NODE_3924_length_5529_cov_1.581584_4_plen_126_part_00